MRTLVLASDKKQNAQEVRRYDTNMRHNRSSTEGSEEGGRVKPSLSFFPPVPFASGEKRSHVISQTWNLCFISIFFEACADGVSKRAPGSGETKQEVLYCTYCIRLLSFPFLECKYSFPRFPPQQKVAALITGMQKAATEKEKKSRKICGTI